MKKDGRSCAGPEKAEGGSVFKGPKVVTDPCGCRYDTQSGITIRICEVHQLMRFFGFAGVGPGLLRQACQRRGAAAMILGAEAQEAVFGKDYFVARGKQPHPYLWLGLDRKLAVAVARSPQIEARNLYAILREQSSFPLQQRLRYGSARRLLLASWPRFVWAWLDSEDSPSALVLEAYHTFPSPIVKAFLRVVQENIPIDVSEWVRAFAGGDQKSLERIYFVWSLNA